MGVIRKLIERATSRTRPNEVGTTVSKGKLLVDYFPAMPAIGDLVDLVHLIEGRNVDDGLLFCTVARDCTVRGTPYKNTKKHPPRVHFNEELVLTKHRIQLIHEFLRVMGVVDVPKNIRLIHTTKGLAVRYTN